MPTLIFQLIKEKWRLSSLLCQSIVVFSVILFACGTYGERLAPALTEQDMPFSSDVGARVINSIQKVVVASDYSWEAVHYYSIKIIDSDAARDYGRIAIAFNHFYSDLELEFANVLTSDGVEKSLQSDALQQRIGSAQDYYDDRSQIVFSLPEIRAGTLLEFQYRVRSLKFTLPDFFGRTSGGHWYQPLFSGRGGRMDPVIKSTYEVVVDNDIDLKTQLLGPVSPEYSRSSVPGAIRHHWIWENLEAVPVEQYSPPYENVVPGVRVSTTNNWREMDSWVWGLVNDKLVPTQRIKKLAASLVSPADSKEEKIKSVYAYLQDNVRYVYAHLGRGGYEPHPAESVVDQRYGDCKDQTMLAIALLSALEIEAYPALIATPRADRPSLELVNNYFDHMLVWVPGEGEKDTWLDTTGERFTFPGISNWFVNQPAFIVNGRGGEKKQISGVTSENDSELYMDYRIDDDGSVWMEMRINLSGINEEWFRQWWKNVDNRESALTQWVSSPFSQLRSNVTVKPYVYNVDSLWNSSSIRVEFDFGKTFVDSDGGVNLFASVSQLLVMLNSLGNLTLPEEREAGFAMEQEQLLKMFVTFSGKENHLASVVESALNESNRFFSIDQSARKVPNGFVIEVTYERKPLILNADEYRKFYTATEKIPDLGSWQIYMRPNKGVTDEAISFANKGAAKPASIKIKRLVEEGKFNEAITSSRSVIDSNQGDGETWYWLGVALGFNADVEESKKAFRKSRELGYRP